MKPILTGLASVSLEEDKILRILFVRNGDLTEAEAIGILGAVLRLSKGNPHALLYDFNRKSILLSNIAKKLASVRNEHDSNMLARAFVTYNLQNNMEATHFINHSKPLCETKVFHSNEEALAWLRSKIKHKA